MRRAILSGTLSGHDPSGRRDERHKPYPNSAAMPFSDSSLTCNPIGRTDRPAPDSRTGSPEKMAASAHGSASPSGRPYAGVAIAALFVSYEYTLHRVAQQPGAEVAGLLLGAAPFILMGLGIGWRSTWRLPLLMLLALACAGLWTLRVPLSQHFGWTYYLQHMGANTALGWMFGRSLRRGHTPLCTQFATIVRGTLPPAVQRYTRTVTVAWTLFFALMATLSTVLFALAPIGTWSTFANLCSPVLVASMFAAEAGCRRLALPGLEHAGVMEAIRGYQAAMAARAGLPR